MMGTLFAYVAGATFVLQDGFGLSAQTFGLVFGANAAGLLLGSQLNPFLLRRHSLGTVLNGSILVTLAASLGLFLCAVTGLAGLAGVLIPLAVVLAAAGVAMPCTPALALEHHAGEAGTAAAVLGCLQFGVGGAIAPLVGAFETTSAVPMSSVMVGLAALAALLMFAVVRPRAGRE